MKVRHDAGEILDDFTARSLALGAAAATTDEAGTGLGWEWIHHVQVGYLRDVSVCDQYVPRRQIAVNASNISKIRHCRGHIGEITNGSHGPEFRQGPAAGAVCFVEQRFEGAFSAELA